MTDQRYTLTVTERTLRTISEACDLMSRVGMGQLEYVADHAPCRETENRSGYRDLRDKLRELRSLATGLPGGQYQAMHATSPEARICYGVHQVIRHQLAWERKPEGDIYVDFDTPRQIVDEPLPELRREEGR